MGYRSEVAYRIGFRDKQILNEFIAKVMVLGGYECDALKECSIEEDGNKWFANFYGADLKWYPDYEDVRGHTNLYEKAVEWYPDDCAYQFLRVGESDDDSECENDGADDILDYVWDDFRIIRYIETPFTSNYEAIGDKLGIIE